MRLGRRRDGAQGRERSLDQFFGTDRVIGELVRVAFLQRHDGGTGAGLQENCYLEGVMCGKARVECIEDAVCHGFVLLLFLARGAEIL